VPFRKPTISHPTVVAYLALFVALGGSAYAAATITGRDVVNGSLTGIDLRNGTLTGTDLRNGTVRSADVSNITGADLGPGAPWTLRSPNGNFALSVSNTGVRMQGPASEVTVDNSGVIVNGAGRTQIRASGPLELQGAVIGLNGTCAPVADATKVFQHTHVAPPDGGTTTVGSGPTPGFTTVLAC
jgi:hypothetical protein